MDFQTIAGGVALTVIIGLIVTLADCLGCC